MKKALRTAAISLLAVAAAGAVAALVVKVEVKRHRRDLFSGSALERLAALGHMAGRDATVDDIMLLRDYIAWEPRKLLRERARAILRAMEEEARERGAAGGRRRPHVQRAG